MPQEYEWLNSVSVMVTAVKGLSADEALRRWGATSTVPGRYDLGELERRAAGAGASQGGQAWIHAEVRGDVVLVWEPASTEGLRSEVLAAVTRDGATALAVMHDLKTEAAFAYAEGGSVLVSAHSLAADGRPRGEDPGRLAEQMARAGVVTDDLRAPACVALLEGLFGVEVVPPTGEHDVLAVRIRPYPQAPRQFHVPAPGRRVHRLRPRPE